MFAPVLVAAAFASVRLEGVTIDREDETRAFGVVALLLFAADGGAVLTIVAAMR